MISTVLIKIRVICVDACFSCLAVAKHLLKDALPAETQLGSKVAQFMGAAHAAVLDANNRYYEQHGKRNHTTSKSFLEFVSLFTSLLASKGDELAAARARLEKGNTD